MAHPVITITRQYASGGAAVARQVAAALAWTVIDNEFVDEVARRAGLTPATVAEHEERAPGLLERLARPLPGPSPRPFIAPDPGARGCWSGSPARSRSPRPRCSSPPTRCRAPSATKRRS